jgi:site-specific recombinase XerD
MLRSGLVDHQIMEGLTPQFYRLIESCGDSNAQTINNYLNAMRSEVSLSIAYKKTIIKTLTYVSKFHSNMKFKKMQKHDIVSFLDSKRKSEVADPLNSWISTYNLYVIVVTRFFKWLYHPNLAAKERPKPSCVEIRKLRRKEQSVYKPTDLWTQDDDLLFLKY